MPDITMCPDSQCPKAATCRRSEQSGTKPDPEWQSWFRFSPRADDRCAEYWPVTRARK